MKLVTLEIKGKKPLIITALQLARRVHRLKYIPNTGFVQRLRLLIKFTNFSSTQTLTHD